MLRILTGALLVYHGTSKVFGGLGNMASSLAERGWPAPELQAFMASYVEFAGGVLLIVGLFTRPTALMVVGMFAIIVFVFHGADPFAKQEKALIFMALGVFVFLTGPGKFSVDNFLFTQTATPVRAEPEAQLPSEQSTPQDKA